ncbi:MAG: hypothetical protein M1838_005968 [Thelocarpon superellum]|nr:MAG: hypothetical protein M1838_005968 [Thelocarpon superellum]
MVQILAHLIRIIAASAVLTHVAAQQQSSALGADRGHCHIPSVKSGQCNHDDCLEASQRLLDRLWDGWERIEDSARKGVSHNYTRLFEGGDAKKYMGYPSPINAYPTPTVAYLAGRQEARIQWKCCTAIFQLARQPDPVEGTNWPPVDLTPNQVSDPFNDIIVKNNNSCGYEIRNGAIFLLTAQSDYFDHYPNLGYAFPDQDLNVLGEKKNDLGD